MQPLVDAVADFERFDPEYTLEHLLADLALKSGGRPPAEGGGVKVASLHGTKGLQWPTVYLVGLEEGKLPDYRADTPEELSEERRACFVGVCRAQNRLVLTYAQSFRGYRQSPSRFLREMALI
jgi:DNA helicase II / ATP-dependent DNA helicase PcrA